MIFHRLHAVQGRYTSSWTLHSRNTLFKGRIVQGKTFGDSSVGNTSPWQLKLVCNVNIVFGNFKSENAQDYVQKTQRNCAFMNSGYHCTDQRDRVVGIDTSKRVSVMCADKETVHVFTYLLNILSIQVGFEYRST